MRWVLRECTGQAGQITHPMIDQPQRCNSPVIRYVLGRRILGEDSALDGVGSGGPMGSEEV
jgi:hypothetical protein